MDNPFQAAVDEHRDTSLADSPHPMLSKEQWADLGDSVPEVTDSIAAITRLEAELRDFRRPMGPDEAITVMRGVEALSRLVDSLHAVTLSVFERVGTPKDYGAKSTKALVQDKLQLSSTEAHRRTELAKNLGNRVDLTGQSRPPKYPIVAAGLQSGALSSSQAAMIGKCLDEVPFWLGVEVRERIEGKLVERAPSVRVSDLRRIFTAMLDRVDPDGTEPTDFHDRSKYKVNVRQRHDGDWDLSGLLDPITGGIIQGWLTSRIKADDPTGADSPTGAGDSTGADSPTGESDSSGADSPTGAGATTGDSRADATTGLDGGSGDGSAHDPTGPGGGPADDLRVEGEQMLELFDSVLAGDITDRPLPADANPQLSGPGSENPRGWGVRADGTFADTSSEQGTVQNLMYERFSTLISHTEMGRVGRGAPFALVVTATAENLAEGKGRATTGAEADFPIDLAADEGLNGTVFFHLMTEKAKSMALATEQRHATPRQLAILGARDKGCTFPGCETPPGWCDAHHVFPWALGGRTDLNNLTLVCSMHHHLIDRSEWETIMLKDGRAAWIPPASIDIERRPILHARFVTDDAVDSLFADLPYSPLTAADVGVDAEHCGPELMRGSDADSEQWGSVPESGVARGPGWGIDDCSDGGATDGGATGGVAVGGAVDGEMSPGGEATGDDATGDDDPGPGDRGLW
ncbi:MULTISPECIES: HNH endonuclease signature motif containing protein [unclassified Brevibacterium]|uniref:HNH endonuclease signature motif containing protein n=1 Tax=unclassified Brevibacterium TaxID=2614124 RepID=UPI00148585CC|nr:MULTISPECIES: HNH endonuclease signature motif containing protein [unclassified Brevibacterium]MCM1012566.1 HNH endonuclease [Brevibacterium sp. XM4083]